MIGITLLTVARSNYEKVKILFDASQIFLHVPPYCDTDRVPQVIAEHLLDYCSISGRKRRTETADLRSNGMCHLAEPVFYQFIK